MKALAHAKINLALAVGPIRPDGLHEVTTLMQRLELADVLELDDAETLTVEGFAEDTLVRRALESVAEAAGAEARWRVRLEKRIPVAAGLGGGSSDAAAALRLANGALGGPLDASELHRLARALGADVAFFLAEGPQLATGEGSVLEPVALPQDYAVLLLLPHGAVKASTGEIYSDFDGAEGFADRAECIRALAGSARTGRDLAELPSNDLARSPLAAELLAHGAFRSDVSGAGPTLYGLFDTAAEAERAAAALGHLGASWSLAPAW